MDFFAAQTEAQRKTRWLVSLLIGRQHRITERVVVIKGDSLPGMRQRKAKQDKQADDKPRQPEGKSVWALGRRVHDIHLISVAQFGSMSCIPYLPF